MKRRAGWQPFKPLRRDRIAGDATRDDTSILTVRHFAPKAAIGFREAAAQRLKAGDVVVEIAPAALAEASG